MGTALRASAGQREARAGTSLSIGAGRPACSVGWPYPSSTLRWLDRQRKPLLGEEARQVYSQRCCAPLCTSSPTRGFHFLAVRSGAQVVVGLCCATCSFVERCAKHTRRRVPNAMVHSVLFLKDALEGMLSRRGSVWGMARQSLPSALSTGCAKPPVPSHRGRPAHRRHGRSWRRASSSPPSEQLPSGFLAGQEEEVPAQRREDSVDCGEASTVYLTPGWRYL